MYAVIETGGKQYKVAEGDTVTVDRLENPVGESVEMRTVRLVVDDGEVVTDRQQLENTRVRGTVTAQNRGKKLRVFKMKRRKGYRRKIGHREELTEILITGIGTEKEQNET